MTTVKRESGPQQNDSHTFEVLGRVLGLLLDSTGPLGSSLGVHLWPCAVGDGFVLTWRGAVPTEIEVIQHLVNSSANDEMTTVLRPGDVLFDYAADDRYTHVEVRGVRFQLRPEAMFRPEELAAWGEFWRRGDLRALLS